MTKEKLIKSAIKALVNEQVKQGSWGYALEEDSAYEVSWQNVLEWLEPQPSKDYISREDIFKRFKELKFYTNHRGMRMVQLVDVIDCVFDASYVQSKTNVLNMIRAEIEALPNINPSYTHTCDVVDREDVLDIIDKYKSESEG